MYVCMYVCMYVFQEDKLRVSEDSHSRLPDDALRQAPCPGEGIEHQSPDGRVVRRVIVPDPDRQHGSVYVLCLT